MEKTVITTSKLIQNAKVGGVLENMGTEIFKIEEEMAQIVHNTKYLLLFSDCSQSEHIRGEIWASVGRGTAPCGRSHCKHQLSRRWDHFHDHHQ